mgnify:CR=1 FL=1
MFLFKMACRGNSNNRNILFLGDNKSGKTSLLKKYTNENFLIDDKNIENYLETFGKI